MVRCETGSGAGQFGRNRLGNRTGPSLGEENLREAIRQVDYVTDLEVGEIDPVEVECELADQANAHLTATIVAGATELLLAEI